MEPLKFTHLHVHTEYSLLDGSAKIPALVARARALGMDSLAITDHGAMYGAIDFYKAALAEGIKPIIGCEVYVAPKSRLIKDPKSQFNYYHLVLLAENNEGYQNLIKLVSHGFTDGFYYKPRIDLDLIRKHHRGIIAASACIAGPVAKNILEASYETARDIALEYNEVFGQGNFFLELQDHGMPEQQTVNNALVRMSGETGIPLICTNDSHYIYKEDAEAHDILLCIQTGKTVNDTDRMRYEGGQFYLKSPEEMAALFPDHPEALENTYEIAKRCNVEFKFHELKLPGFDVPEGQTAAGYLRQLCLLGLNKRYKNPSPEIESRLLYELSVIGEMGYVDYFLIVWDFIRYAKENGIVVGPGRGSAAGSLVSYCLDITAIDPIKYNLLFERFLNPERVSMPDIDVDFCYERRQEVIDYVIRKYGDDHVAQIITFGTLAARAAIKDVGRALAMPYKDVDRISKMIPSEIGMTIEKALAKSAELMRAYDEEEDTRFLINMSKSLEGLPRHASTHAAGVVICRDPVVEYVPLNSNDGVITTQFTMNTLEELGLLKMDFLGLRNLTVIQNAVKEIQRIHNVNVDLDNLNDGDKRVYDLISQGKTEGVFQLESNGMKQFMKELRPEAIDDLIAGISLYRPGPMEFIPKYVRGKHSAGEIKYTHESLKPILEDTYGCIVYQEQVMQIVRDLAGYSMGRSDLVRRAMSKKKASVMSEERKNFVYGTKGVPGCVKNGIPASAAERIFDEMTDFAKYAFNKSHAAAYAVVGYQTAWLKTYYPVEFMAALMTSVMDNAGKISDYIEECKKMNVPLLPPDINKSYGRFSVEDGRIRFGLSAVKNAGRSAIDAVVSEREKNGPFRSLTEFCQRMDGGEINRRCLESLIKAGAFDALGGSRAQYMSAYKSVLEGLAHEKKNNLEGQLTLFGEAEEKAAADDILPDVLEYPEKEKLIMEKEVLGIYISGHPLSRYGDILRKKTTCGSQDFIFSEEEGFEGGVEDGGKVVFGGIIAGKSVKYTRNNKAMAFLTVEDMLGAVEVIVFPELFEKVSGGLSPDSVVLVEGRASVSYDEAKIIASGISVLNETFEKICSIGVIIGKDGGAGKLLPILRKYPGEIPVYINDKGAGKLLKAGRSLWVDGSGELITELKETLGEENIRLKPGRSREAKNG